MVQGVLKPGCFLQTGQPVAQVMMTQQQQEGCLAPLLLQNHQPLGQTLLLLLLSFRRQTLLHGETQG
jgi:hypothetical protein